MSDIEDWSPEKEKKSGPEELMRKASEMMDDYKRTMEKIRQDQDKLVPFVDDGLKLGPTASSWDLLVRVCENGIVVEYFDLDSHRDVATVFEIATPIAFGERFLNFIKDVLDRKSRHRNLGGSVDAR